MHQSRNVFEPASDSSNDQSDASAFPSAPGKNRKKKGALGSLLRSPAMRGLAAAILLIPAIIWAGPGVGGVYNVTVASDTGSPDELRAAINAVNRGAACGAQPCTIIQFAASMNGSTIFINSPLPQIVASNVFIDGYSAAPGQINAAAFGSPLNNQPPIILTDTGGNTNDNGFDVVGNNVRIRGFQLRQLNNAIILSGTGASIEGNWIGTDTLGTGALGNNIGVLVTGSGNAIGGASDDKRNLISGNSTGIQLNGNTNTIETNYIGTDKTGTLSLRNAFFGVDVGSAATGNLIGQAGRGNVIGGNGTSISDGNLRIAGDGNSVLSNRIGTNAAGSAALAGSSFGVQLLTGAINNDVGLSGAGNLISGNQVGVVLQGDSNRVRFNAIGTNLLGSAAVPNASDGIQVSSNNNLLASNLIAGNTSNGINIPGVVSGNGIQTNTIGKSALGNLLNGIALGSNVSATTINANNDIGFNGANGVVVTGSGGGSFANRITDNSIHDNTALGIDLQFPTGVDTNDVGDADFAPGNRGQNYPVLSSAFNNGLNTQLRVSVDSASVATTLGLLVQVFRADAAAQEGQTLLGQACFAGNTLSNANMTVTGAASGDRLVGTATSFTTSTCGPVNDGTSEFSAALIVVACPTITVNPATLPNGTRDLAYGPANVSATGGTAPYSFSVVAGAGALPDGLSLNSGTGDLTGTPSVNNSFNFTVRATDANGCFGDRPYTVTIACPGIALSPPGLPNGTQGTPYSQTLTAAGGNSPYTFAVPPGALPPGLALTSAGVLSGTPTTPGSSTFTVTATEASGGCTGTRIYTVVIGCPTITVTPAPPNGTTGTAYSHTFTPSGGTAPYTFSISAGTLPPGLTMSPAGVISGTPTKAGGSSFTVSVTDANSCPGSAPFTINISNLSADLSITKTDGQSTADAGTPITYFIKATNAGPSPVVGATVTDNFPSQLSGVTWTCSATAGSSCPASGTGNINALVNLLAGGSATFVATGATPSTSTGTITNTATVTPPGTISDPNSANNSATDSTQLNLPPPPPPPCPTVPVITSPTAGSTTVPPSGTIEFSTSNSDTNIVYLGREGQGCSTELGRTSGNSIAYSGLTPGQVYEARVESLSAGCSTLQSSCIRFTVAAGCGAAPRLISPKPNDRVTSPPRFEWEAVPGNPEYGLFVGERGETPTLRIRTRETSATLTNLSPGRIVAFVEAYFPNCPPARSPEVGFETVCGQGPVPEPAAVGKVTTGEDFEVTFPVQAPRYQLEESTNPRFEGATVLTIDVVPGSSIVRVPFRKQVTALSFFYYRVRALNACNNQFGPFSYILRVAIEVPVVPVVTSPRADVDVTTEFGSTEKIIQTIFLPGSNAGNADTSFTATTDEPWITVSPSGGSIPPTGVTLTVTIDPTGLPVGTNTGTVIIITTSPGAKFVANATTRRNLPTSVNLVTPMTPKGRNIPPPNALIIPAVGHTDGINSKWLSDIRVTNTSGQAIKYLMTFTPSGIDGTQTGKQTEVTILPNVTTAMDDIVNNWYGLGQGSENINGALEIRPINFSGKNALDVVSAATVASSRTYNSTPTGTLGQFVPGVPFSSFVGKLNAQGSAAVMNMQQISQNSAYRTNMGIVEGSGEPATVLISVFNTAGQKLTEFSHTLKPAEHVQLNGVLSSRNITLNDGRIEVRVTSDTGRVTAYASVIDNATGDPILVPAVQTDGLSVNKLILLGVADIDTGVNRWKTDMRLFNAGIATANATLVFYPQDDPAAAKSIQVSVPPGQILVLDNLLQTRFGVTNIGGAVHVNTGNASALVASARTYDQRPNGTLSLFVPAVKPEEAAGIGDRALQVQQLEQSDRFRTHLGIAEVTGNKVTVEISAALPNTTATPKFQIELDGNEFTQITQVLSRLNIVTAYNARVTVKVISGTGRVTAYGSVIDNATHDPTYIPAQ